MHRSPVIGDIIYIKDSRLLHLVVEKEVVDSGGLDAYTFSTILESSGNMPNPPVFIWTWQGSLTLGERVTLDVLKWVDSAKSVRKQVTYKVK